MKEGSVVMGGVDEGENLGRSGNASLLTWNLNSDL